MSYQFYKIIHLVGIFLVLTSLGGIILHVLNGGTKNFGARKLNAALHGLGLFLALLGGFGLLARIGIVGSWPAWVLIKLGVWLILGGIPVLIYRQPKFAKLFWALIILFAGLSAYMAVYKPVLGAGNSSSEQQQMAPTESATPQQPGQ